MKKEEWEKYEDSCAKLLKSKEFIFNIENNRKFNFSDSRRSKAKLIGTNNVKHQIDIILKKDNMYLCGECKFHKAPVEKNEVMAFIKTIENISEQNNKKRIYPIFISSSSFNKGALSMLQHYNIDNLIFYPTEKPHFTKSQICVKEIFYSKKKSTQSNPSDVFYNDFHGMAEPIEDAVNMFDFYKIANTNIPFKIRKCNKATKIEASNPIFEIREFKNMTLGRNVSKIIFEYDPSKNKRKKAVNQGTKFKDQIGLLTIDEKQYEVLDDYSFVELKNQVINN